MAHTPVLMNEVLSYLDPQPNENFIDGTLGDGGHTGKILEITSPNGRVLAFDLDPEAIVTAGHNLAKFGDRFMAVNANFAEMGRIADEKKFGPVSGILMDFGFSSPQLEERSRGLSFQKSEPLDMRYSPANELTAAEIVNTWPKDDLVKILVEYGEERLAPRVAEAIIARRRKQRILTTDDLAQVVAQTLPKSYEHGRINPATRTFQALRIAVNDELGSIKRVLPQAVRLLEEGGILACISFHSLEDRLVKDFFRSTDELEVLTKKPVTATEGEISNNPRARSAKLRAAKKIKN